jgi:hypothetical protein
MMWYRDYKEDGIIGERPSSQISIEPDADGLCHYAKNAFITGSFSRFASVFIVAL